MRPCGDPGQKQPDAERSRRRNDDATTAVCAQVKFNPGQIMPAAGHYQGLGTVVIGL